MRRVAFAIVSTAAALVLLLSFKSHGSTSLASPAAAVSTATGSSGTTSGSSSSGLAATKQAKKTPSPTTKTVTGDAADTMYGPVQVQIKVTNGKVTAVRAIEYPYSDPRDAQINSYAIPVLNEEATQAGSANIDMVSGATYTSNGYLQSLQSALDKAGV
jgi:uncharacterized protein with FMN-binding domain